MKLALSGDNEILCQGFFLLIQQFKRLKILKKSLFHASFVEKRLNFDKFSKSISKKTGSNSSTILSFFGGKSNNTTIISSNINSQPCAMNVSIGQNWLNKKNSFKYIVTPR